MDHILRSLICSVHQIHLGDQIQKNDMGRAHSKCGGESFGGET